MTAVDTPTGSPAPIPAPPSGFRHTLREAARWRELRGTPYGLRPLLVLCWVSLFVGLSGAVLGLASLEIVRDLDIDLPTLINYSSFAGTVSIVAFLGVAYYCDRHARLPVFGLGMVLGGLFSIVAARGRTGLTFGAPLVASGTSIGAASVPVNSLLPDYYPVYSRGRVFAVLGLFGALGTALAPFFAGEVIARFGFRGAYTFFAIPVLLIGLLALVLLREPVRGYMDRRELGADEEAASIEDEPVSFGEGWRTVWGVRTLRRIFIANLFTSAATGMYGLASLFFLINEYGLGPASLGRYAAVVALFALPGFYLGGGLIDTLMRRRPSQVLVLYGLLSLVAAVGTLVLPLRPPLWVVVIGSGVTAFGGALIGPALGVLYVQLVPAHVRTLAGAIFGLADLPGRVIFLPLLGVIITAYGLRAGLVLPFPLLVIGAFVFLSAAGLFEGDMRSALAANLARDEWRKAKSAGAGKLLVCRDVDVEYDGVQVLFGVDFDVEENEIIALLGTNGAGKSTLLRAICGSQQAASGGIVYDGRDITRMPPHETARRGIVLMPGGRGVFPALTVRENLLLGAWSHADGDDLRESLREVFDLFPALRARAGEQASSLSGGEQQMLSLAQAFLARPRLLMIDELSLGLSPAVVGQLLEVLREIHRRGVTIIIVEQSVNVALSIAEKAIFMEKGEVRFFGRTADLLRRPDILRAVYVKGAGALTDGAPARAGRSAREERELRLRDSHALLRVEGLVKRFGGVTALDGVSFDVRDGETLGLIGPNGSGKTTLFEIVSGYQAADAGTVVFDGLDVSDLPPHERARRGLVRRFQDARLFPSLTVYETILVALEQRFETRSNLLNALQVPGARRSERRARLRADRLVELLDLGGYQDKFVRELSTGLRRIVDLACVLATEPRLLLLDEPSSGIAQAEAEGLGPLLRRIRHETGCTILIVEHDMPLVSAVADELLALDGGRVLLRGTPGEVLEDERVIESYLGGSEAAVRRSGSLT